MIAITQASVRWLNICNGNVDFPAASRRLILDISLISQSADQRQLVGDIPRDLAVCGILRLRIEILIELREIRVESGRVIDRVVLDHVPYVIEAQQPMHGTILVAKSQLVRILAIIDVNVSRVMAFRG